MRLSALLVCWGSAVVVGAGFLALLEGCGGGSGSTAAAATIATAGDNRLDGATLQRWLLKTPRLPDQPVAELLVSTWLDAALLVDALRNGPKLDDSAMTAKVIEQDVLSLTALQVLNARAKNFPAVTDAQADSLADVDNVRVFQDLYLAVPPRTDSVHLVAIVNRARGLMKRAQDGTAFTALVREASMDSASRIHDGFLPAVTRDQLPAPIGEVLWQLKAGDITKIIPNRTGFHLFRRANRDESRAGLKAWLAPVFAQRKTSIFVDSLSQANHLEVAPGAPVRLRALAAEPVVADPGTPYATWTGGSLKPEDLRVYVLMQTPIERDLLHLGSDSGTTMFIYTLAQRMLVLQTLQPPPAEMAAQRERFGPVYRRLMDSLKAHFSGGPASTSAGAVAAAYVDSLSSDSTRHPRPLPGGLAAALRSKPGVSVDQHALDDVLRSSRLIWQQQHVNDTSKTAGPRPPTPAAPPAGKPAPKPH